MGRVGSGHTKRTHGQRWSRVRAARLRVVSSRQFPLRSTTSSCSRDYGHTRRAGRRRLPRRPTPAARRPRRRRCRPTRATRAAARRNLATVLRFTLRPDAFRHRRHSLGNLLYFLEKNGRKLDAQFRRYASAQTHTRCRCFFRWTTSGWYRGASTSKPRPEKTTTLFVCVCPRACLQICASNTPDHFWVVCVSEMTHFVEWIVKPYSVQFRVVLVLTWSQPETTFGWS